MKSCRLLLALLLCIAAPGLQARDSGEKQYDRLRKAADRYMRLSEREIWNPIMLPGRRALRFNDTSEVIPLIKRRLNQLGDLHWGGTSNEFTLRFEEAVKQFQVRHGLEDDGIIGPAFIRALNVPPDRRIEQLTVNMERIMFDTLQIEGTRIIANIPDYRLYVYEGGNEVLSMDIVVGKISNPTVVFSDTLEQVIFSPYWNVPESIVRNEILPALNRNPSYLSANNMEITGRRNGFPVVRQMPGPENSLGKVKFMFPNEHSIYFHDTPAKALFDRENRAFSHGCIRLSEPFKLARYLLKDQPEWTDTAILDAMNRGEETPVDLLSPVPVSIIYYTAWVDSSGLVHFRDDIYGRDGDVMTMTQEFD